MGLFSKNSSDAIVTQLTEHQPALLAFIITLIPGDPSAPDILQRVNLVIWKKRRDFKEGSNFKNKKLGSHLPNIHWTKSTNRLAELNTGLISINEDFSHKDLSKSYQKTVSAFSNSKSLTKFDNLFLIFGKKKV